MKTCIITVTWFTAVIGFYTIINICTERSNIGLSHLICVLIEYQLAGTKGALSSLTDHQFQIYELIRLTDGQFPVLKCILITK